MFFMQSNNPDYLQQAGLAAKQILSYWATEAINPADGQYYGEIDFYGNKMPQANKGIIMYSRILWSFSAAYRNYANPAYLANAQIAYKWIQDCFYDTQHGGYYWETSAAGQPTVLKKQTYAQAFVLYALSEYYLATGNGSVKKNATELFLLIEQHCLDKKQGGYFEAFAREWSRLDDVRLSQRDANEQKSMNTNLHIMEAYTCYYKAAASEQARLALAGITELFCKHIVGSDGHLVLFFNEHWQKRSNVISYGHDIEASWLLCEAAEASGVHRLAQLAKAEALKIADVFMAEGIADDGSVYYEYTPGTGHLDTDRHWWPQVEAIEGLLNAYRLSGNAKYRKAALRTWKYAAANFPDKQNGEWHWAISASGQPDTSRIKAGAWKAPYHSTRALMKLEAFMEFENHKMPAL
jgi:cellobiose epimerase